MNNSKIFSILWHGGAAIFSFCFGIYAGYLAWRTPGVGPLFTIYLGVALSFFNNAGRAWKEIN